MTEPMDGLGAFHPALTRPEFAWIADFVYTRTGIVMKEGKQNLVTGRLARRLRHHGLNSYTEYIDRLKDPNNPEIRLAIDLLTTNETYFFREPKHFRFLRELMTERRPERSPVRVWSAASSSGEEAYSIAMTLADCLPATDWEVFGTDISSRMVQRARSGLYPLDAADKIPRAMLQKYCLRGKAEIDGYLAIHPVFSTRVKFERLNLIEPLPALGYFEVIFLRNVMIYFDLDTKRALVQRVSSLLRPGGFLLVGHSETLNGIQEGLTLVHPSIYRRTDGSPGTP